ncbi:MAG: diguanylate cyclase [Candidatus Omnitrophica bacterium]|nr:diguanylate cyclase [Candidatus Omnitrophota bacterium]
MPEKIKRILIISSDENLKKVLNFCFDGWGYEVFLHDSPVNDINQIKKISPDAIVVDVYSASKTHLQIVSTIKEDLITAFIPIITLINKRQLREQLLHLKQGVDDYLIKPPDPLDLRVRIEMAIKRAQYSFYTTPLTGLPGGRLIEEALKDRLSKNSTFSFGYIDIDNFKYFNDVYGYVKGDRIIMQTAYILYTIIRKFGNKDDFIGHIGGDDFVFITSLDKNVALCQNFICMFDNIVPFHYTLADRARGFIVARDRNKKVRKTDLVSVSVAVINKRNPGEFRSIVEINEKVAEIKHYLKGIPGSKFMADRRENPGLELQDPSIYQKKEVILQAYRPLGQILLEDNSITSEQLDEALKIHWRRDIRLGETLLELGFINEPRLKTALNLQKDLISHLIES